MATTPGQDRPEIRFHDQIAPQWEGLHRGRVFRSRTAAMFALIDAAQLSGQSWLDAGCGTGTLSRMLASRGCKVTGLDASADMIRIATNRPNDDAPAGMLSFDQIDTIEDVPFEAGSFDGILCASVLEYTVAPDKCLAEFNRLLRIRGLLLVSIPNRQSLVRRLYKLLYGFSRTFALRPAFRYLQFSRFEASVAEATDLLRRHGLTILDHNFAGSPLPRMLDRHIMFGTLINILARRNSGGTQRTAPADAPN